MPEKIKEDDVVRWTVKTEHQKTSHIVPSAKRKQVGRHKIGLVVRVLVLKHITVVHIMDNPNNAWSSWVVPVSDIEDVLGNGHYAWLSELSKKRGG